MTALNSKLIVRSLAVIGLSMAPSVLLAHGPQIPVTVENGRIVTHALHLVEEAAPNAYLVGLAERVFSIPMAQRSGIDANDGWYSQPSTASNATFLGPGLAYGRSTFAENSILTVSFVDAAKFWDGDSFEPTGGEILQGGKGSFTAPVFANAMTSSGVVAGTGLTMGAAPAVGVSLGAHTGLRWRILGDGSTPNSVSDDGIYLATLQVSSTEAGLLPSLPYYFLFNKNASPSVEAAALAYVNAVLVPEPSFALMGLSAGLLLLRRRNEKH